MAPKSEGLRWWHRAILMLGGVVVAIVLVIGMLTLFPNLLPNEAGREQFADEQLEIEFYYSDGDLFAWLPGRVRPPEDNDLVAQYSLAWDADGFRVPAMPADSYPIVALGDSFTEGPNVPLPWPDVVAQEMGIPVYNYGYRAYGPQENAQVAADFLPRDNRQWVLYGHFGGNDIFQAEVPEDALVQERTPVQLIPFLAGRAADTVEREVAQLEDHYDYPMPVTIGGFYYEMAILTAYMWWQVAPEEGFVATRAYAVIGDTLDTIEASTDDNTCLAFVFIPPKGNLYLPYMGYTQDDILGIAERPTIMPDGTVQLQPDPQPIEALPDVLESLYGQRDAMAQLATEKGWLFIDLLEPMEQAVAQGELLYYRYDTHFNQAGHTLAGDIIAEAMRNAESCSV